jgi:DNA-binding CsgD family transcriptional regulator
MDLRAIDHLVLGVVFLDRDGRALAMNRSAGRSFERRGLDGPWGKIPRALVERARGGGCGACHFDGLDVLVCPLSVMPLVDQAAAVAFITDPAQRIEAARERLGELYGLTAAEERVAAELMQGASVEEIAAELHLSPHTVRTQLKRIYGKTSTNRQGELIRLLLTGPAVVLG